MSISTEDEKEVVDKTSEVSTNHFDHSQHEAHSEEPRELEEMFSRNSEGGFRTDSQTHVERNLSNDKLFYASATPSRLRNLNEKVREYVDTMIRAVLPDSFPTDNGEVIDIVSENTPAVAHTERFCGSKEKEISYSPTNVFNVDEREVGDETSAILGIEESQHKPNAGEPEVKASPFSGNEVLYRKNEGVCHRYPKTLTHVDMSLGASGSFSNTNKLNKSQVMFSYAKTTQSRSTECRENDGSQSSYTTEGTNSKFKYDKTSGVCYRYPQTLTHIDRALEASGSFSQTKGVMSGHLGHEHRSTEIADRLLNDRKQENCASDVVGHSKRLLYDSRRGVCHKYPKSLTHVDPALDASGSFSDWRKLYQPKGMTSHTSRDLDSLSQGAESSKRTSSRDKTTDVYNQYPKSLIQVDVSVESPGLLSSTNKMPLSKCRSPCSGTSSGRVGGQVKRTLRENEHGICNGNNDDVVHVTMPTKQPTRAIPIQTIDFNSTILYDTKYGVCHRYPKSLTHVDLALEASGSFSETKKLNLPKGMLPYQGLVSDKLQHAQSSRNANEHQETRKCNESRNRHVKKPGLCDRYSKTLTHVDRSLNASGSFSRTRYQRKMDNTDTAYNRRPRANSQYRKMVADIGQSLKELGENAPGEDSIYSSGMSYKNDGVCNRYTKSLTHVDLSLNASGSFSQTPLLWNAYVPRRNPTSSCLKREDMQYSKCGGLCSRYVTTLTGTDITLDGSGNKFPKSIKGSRVKREETAIKRPKTESDVRGRRRERSQGRSRKDVDIQAPLAPINSPTVRKIRL